MFDTNSISLERKIFDNLLSNIRGLNKEDSESLYYSIINREEYLENLIANYKTISIFDQLDINYFHKIKDLLLFQIEKFQIEKETLIEENSLLEVKEATKEIHLQKIIQRVEQKISYLNEFKKNVKVLFFENFKTLINVDGTKENTLNIDTKSGVATLPLKERKKANIKVFRILNESNGVPGNVIDGSGRLISVLLEETDSYFQYTKLHEGPLKLVIEVTLKKEEVINEFEIFKFSKESTGNLILKNVVYRDSSENKVSFQRLVDKTLINKEIDYYQKKEGFSIKHVPVKAKTIEIFLQSTEHSIINNIKTFKIDLKHINFYSNKYFNSGRIYFKENKILEDLFAYSAKVTENTWPKKESESFEVNKKIKFNNEGYYSLNDSALIINEEKDSYAIFYEIERKDDAQETILDEKEKDIVKTNVIQKIFSRNFSPNIFEKKNLKNTIIYQPNIFRRSNNINEGIVLGKLESTKQNFDLPVNIYEKEIEAKDIRIFVDSEELTKVFEEEELIENTFLIDKNGNYVKIKSNSVGSNCKILLSKTGENKYIEGEQIFFELEENFEPNKNNINVTSIDYNNIVNVSKEIEIENLNEEYIISEKDINLDSIELKVESSEIDFELSLKDNRFVGVSLVNENDIRKKITINYNFYKRKKINNFSLFKENLKFKGICFNINEIEISNKENFISAGVKEKDLDTPYIIKKSVKLNSDLFGEDKIIKEVEYLNGELEFKNLKLIDKEIVPNLEARNGAIEFTLSQVPFVGSGLKINVFKNDEIVNDIHYEINNENKRIIKIFINDIDSNGYSLKYYYQVKELSTEYFSIDYSKGRICFSSEVINGGNISYNIGDVDVEYSIINYIENYSVEENTIKVNTENLLKINNYIRFCETINENKYELKDMMEYFSPLIYNIKMEMS